LLPVQRFFSPFWTRRRKFQRTTEKCHHTEYERVCPVKFWYYNNLITNQQNTLIIDKLDTCRYAEKCYFLFVSSLI
jgi:NAD-dependent dihydropyrimidine dehydrogenase PreA subunit